MERARPTPASAAPRRQQRHTRSSRAPARQAEVSSRRSCRTDATRAAAGIARSASSAARTTSVSGLLALDRKQARASRRDDCKRIVARSGKYDGAGAVPLTPMPGGMFRSRARPDRRAHALRIWRDFDFRSDDADVADIEAIGVAQTLSGGCCSGRLGARPPCSRSPSRTTRTCRSMRAPDLCKWSPSTHDPTLPFEQSARAGAVRVGAARTAVPWSSAPP